MDVSFAGLGRMGLPMALHLAEAGRRLAVFDPYWSGEARRRLADAGATVLSSPAELGLPPVSISMLPDGSSTQALLLDAGGLVEHATPGHVHVVMGTMGPGTIRDIAQRAAAHDVRVVDAPVSGSVSMAEAATLTTMVGADSAAFEVVQPLLAAMTAAQFHVGPPGAGSVAKLAINLIVGALNEAVAEALVLAEREHLSADSFYDVLEASAAAAPYVLYKRAAFLDPDSTKVAAPLSIIHKDLGLALDVGRNEGVALPVAEACFEVLDESMKAGEDALDMAEVARAVRRRSGMAQPTAAERRR